jgi:integrase
MARATQKSDVIFRNAKPRAKVYLIADGNGLCLRVTPNGSKLWVFRYTHPITHKPNMLSLGKYPDITAAHARDEAKAARIDVYAGRDPQETRRARFDPAYTAPDSDFGSRARVWLDSKERDWSPESHRKAKYVLETYLIPELKGFGIGDLATKHVKPVLQQLAVNTPSLAKKARQYLGGIILGAIQDGLREDGKYLGMKGILPRSDGGHIAAATRPQDISPLLRAIDVYASPVTRAALQICALTALRPGVVARARWDEIDLDAAEWHIPGSVMKMRHAHVVPLPRQAVAILKNMRDTTFSREWVFPAQARQKTPHLHRDALSKALREMGFQGQHATHGFRGMMRTVARERLQIPADVLEAQLAHAKKGDVQKAYDRTDFLDERHIAMQKWADFLDKLKKANAVPLKKSG